MFRSRDQRWGYYVLAGAMTLIAAAIYNWLRFLGLL